MSIVEAKALEIEETTAEEIAAQNAAVAEAEFFDASKEEPQSIEEPQSAIDFLIEFGIAIREGYNIQDLNIETFLLDPFKHFIAQFKQSPVSIRELVHWYDDVLDANIYKRLAELTEDQKQQLGESIQPYLWDGSEQDYIKIIRKAVEDILFEAPGEESVSNDYFFYMAPASVHAILIQMKLNWCERYLHAHQKIIDEAEKISPEAVDLVKITIVSCLNKLFLARADKGWL